MVMPRTVPVVLTEAIDGLLLLQVPPAAASVRAMVVPAHTVAGPDMVPAFGSGLMVTVAVAAMVPQLPVMV